MTTSRTTLSLGSNPTPLPFWPTIALDCRATVDAGVVSGWRFWAQVLAKIALNPRVRAVLLFRVAHVLYQRRLAPLAYLLRARSLRSAGAEIHPAARIGPGLCLVHSSGVVVGGNTVIGSNCRLHQGVTLGEPGRGRVGDWGEPVVGDDVIIGAHAVLLGPIRIGDGARIAANAVVTKDVPAGAVVGGVPARVLRAGSSAQE
jgi:serine O-acetyltransferase